MKVNMHASLAHAARVVRLVNLPASVSPDVWSEPWENGWAPGLRVKGFGGEARVCAARGGTFVELDPTGDARARRRRLFAPGDERAAAAFVRAMLMSLAGAAVKTTVVHGGGPALRELPEDAAHFALGRNNLPDVDMTAGEDGE